MTVKETHILMIIFLFIPFTKILILLKFMNKCFEQDKKKFILENTEEFFPSNSAFMDFH